MAVYMTVEQHFKDMSQSLRDIKGHTDGRVTSLGYGTGERPMIIANQQTFNRKIYSYSVIDLSPFLFHGEGYSASVSRGAASSGSMG